MTKALVLVTLLAGFALCACDGIPELVITIDTSSSTDDPTDTDSGSDSDTGTETGGPHCSSGETYTQCIEDEVILFDGCDHEVATEATCDPAIQECTNTSDRTAICDCLSEYALGGDCTSCLENRNPEDGCFGCAPGFTGADCDQCVRYVDVNSWEPLPDGLSWKTAFTDIQSGINAAAAAIATGAFGECAVWVAQGTYDIYQYDESNSLDLVDNVSLYGGFEGVESDLQARDWVEHETILNGKKIVGEQEVRVNRILNSGDRSTLDGFTVTGGDGYKYFESVIAIMEDTMTIRHCTFTDNIGPLIVHYLQGDAHQNDPIIIENCVFRDNDGLLIRGGSSNAQIRSNVFIDNTNLDTDPNFNCLLDPADVNPFKLSNNTFYGNHVSSDSSTAVICVSGADLKIHNNLFWGNDGKAIVRYDSSSLNTVEYNNVSTSDDRVWTVDLSSDPMFVDEAGGDLRLMSSSPFIDAGSCSWAPELDAKGLPRVDIPAVPNTGEFGTDFCDLGAFEYQIP